MFGTVVYDSLGGWRDHWLLGRSNRRHLVLTGLFHVLDCTGDGCFLEKRVHRRFALPRPLFPCAVGPNLPVECPGFGPYIPGHGLHEKGLQRQIAVGTLVNSQQRRALAVPLLNRGQTADKPRMNRWSTAGQPRALFPHRFT